MKTFDMWIFTFFVFWAPQISIHLQLMSSRNLNKHLETYTNETQIVCMAGYHFKMWENALCNMGQQPFNQIIITNQFIIIINFISTQKYIAVETSFAM